MLTIEFDGRAYRTGIVPALTITRHDGLEIIEGAANHFVELAQLFCPINDGQWSDRRYPPGMLLSTIHRGPLEEHPGGASVEISMGEGLVHQYAPFVEFGTARHGRAQAPIRKAQAMVEVELSA